MNSRQIRSILSIAMIASYAVGLVCLFLGALQTGFALWALSTVGGIAILYHTRNHEEKEEAARKVQEDDSPCE